MADIPQLEKIATQVRRDIVRMVHNAQSGHPGGAMSSTEFMVALYFEIMKHDPKRFTPEAKEQDAFYLSIGHISAVWYSVLARTGYFNVKKLASFRQLDSLLQGHPANIQSVDGIRISSGSLGQGLSAAIGHALSKRLDADPNTVWALLGDGELQEGQIWEAAMFAANHKVDNLIAAVDYNHKQIDGNVEDVIDLGNLRAKWEAFGWKVLETNGNDMAQVVETLRHAKTLLGNGQPLIILLKTIMGKGVDFMEDDHHWHGVPPKDDELEKALAQLEETLGDF